MFIPRSLTNRPILSTLIIYVVYLVAFCGGCFYFLSGDENIAANEVVADVEYYSDQHDDNFDIFTNADDYPYRKIIVPGRQVLRFPLTGNKLEGLRVDPTAVKGRSFRLHSLELRTFKDRHSLDHDVRNLLEEKDAAIADLEVLKNGRLRAQSGDPQMKYPIIQDLVIPDAVANHFSAARLYVGMAVIVMVASFFLLVTLWKHYAQDLGSSLAVQRLSKTDRWVGCALGLAVFIFLALYKPHITPAQIVISQAPASTRDIVMYWDSGSGFRRVEQLPMKRDNDQLSVALPQLPISQIKFSKRMTNPSSVALVLNNGSLQPLSADRNGVFAVPNSLRYALHPLQLLAQLLVGVGALAAAFGLIFIVRNWRGVSSYFGMQQRYFGLLIFLFSTPFFAFWVLGQWPGSFSHDSVYVWNIAKNLLWSIDHPVLNPLSCLMTQQIYDSPVTLVIIQALLAALLIGYAYHIFYRQGVSEYLLVPCWIAVLLSIPVGLYSTMIWKDIPFAFAIVFWALFLYKNYLAKERNGQREISSYAELSFLLLSTTGFLFRHGGEALMFIIIGIIFASKIFTWQTARRLSLGIVVLFFAQALFFSKIIKVDQSALPFYKAFSLMNMMGAMQVNNYFTTERMPERKIFEKFVYNAENLNNYMAVNIAPIHMKGVNNSISAEDANAIATVISRATLFNPGIFLADRVAIFFSSMNEMRKNYYGMTFYNLLWNQALPAIYPEPNVFYLVEDAPFPWLAEKQQALYFDSMRAKPSLSGRFLVWNTVPFFMAMLACLLLSRWLPATGLYCFLIIVFGGVVFLTTPTNNWRYTYFIYLGGLFLLPVILAELRQRCSIQKLRSWMSQ